MNKFNINEFVINFCESDNNKIVDKSDVPNLLLLDSYDLISIVLRKKSNIFIQFDENSSKNFLDVLYLRIETTNSILRSLGNINYLILSKSKLEKKEIKSEIIPVYSLDFNQYVKEILNKLDILRTSIKLSSEDLTFTNIQTDDSSIFFNKNINNSCNNCGDCINSCPTSALLYNDKKDSIFFVSGKCIDCNLCEEVCKENAISKNNNIDLIAFAFEQKSKKISFTQ